jgi:chemotaxis protein methyltransferase WspC
MSLPQITALLYQTIGLDIASVGTSLIERAVKRRVSANDLRDISQYADFLQRSAPELQKLVEAVVIPETFFFRYPESFVALRQIVGEQFLFRTQTVRALSAPCSTGEEPYSIAMTLLDAGLSAEKFQIDAIDVSSHSLDIARLGTFGSNSFRGTVLRFRDQHFQKRDSGFRLFDRVRQCVKFEQGNVLEEHFRIGSEPYDFIFCRNLLIYFDSGAQGRVLKSLRQLLTADGLLFVGSAETGLLKQHGFSSAKLPMAFAFRKSESISAVPLPKSKKPKACSPARVCRMESDRKVDLAAIPKKAAPETAKRPQRLVPDLAVAEQLADQGQLGEAAEICEASIREEGPSARAFHLLGLIRDGAGDPSHATEFYRKALYLQPDHYHALIHLSLLKEKTGDTVAAKTLKNRALSALERAK